ncbi:MAG: helix-turn-helix domain-containing protein [Bilifractor sp.]|nr:helix-turn-helix domain-containing protein [Eubacterium sp.]MDY2836559.1 helix-turn-helix domain-containing protein [Bilifractor sp.]
MSNEITDPIEKTGLSDSDPSRFQSGFRPPLQVVADALTLAGIEYLISDTPDELRLRGIRIFSAETATVSASNHEYVSGTPDAYDTSFAKVSVSDHEYVSGTPDAYGTSFSKDSAPVSEYLYICSEQDIKDIPDNLLAGRAFLLLCRDPSTSFRSSIPGRIYIRDTYRLSEILSLVQDLFDRFHEWDLRIQEAFLLQTPLQEIFDLSQKIFRNPIFLHDRDFIILAECNYPEQKMKRGRDRRTGLPMVQMDLINDFRTDPVYIEGLKERKPVMYPSEQTGYQILYRNIWQGDIYRGRILDLEVDSRILPGDFAVIDYLGKLLEHFLYSGDLRKFSISDDTNDLMARLCEKKETDEQQIQSYLRYQNWKQDDRYVVMRIVTQQRDFNIISSYAVLNQINTILAAGRAFFHQDGITLVVNLSYAHEKTSDVVSRLAVLMRDSLLKIGVSSEIRDFFRLGTLFDQANIALNFGLSGDSMIWYYYFDQYMLDYMIRCSTEGMPADMLCADALQKLLEYDRKNHTSLAHTLEAYLVHDRNVLRTSKELYIHRSTLSYRLDKIRSLISINLDDPKERIKLLLSYYMLGMLHA